MKLIKPYYEILYFPTEHLQLIENAGRTCYLSWDKQTEDSASKFCEMLVKRRHYSVIEHASATVKFVCDRGVSHELVRHRLASYSQESTRWCNYSGEVTFIIPPWIDIEQGTYIWPHVAINIKDKPVELWFNTILEIEKNYQWLISVGGWKPEQARSVLPNSLKTEIVMTANLREWRHVFQQRCDENAHPQMRELMIPLLNEFKQIIPVVFDDLEFA